MKKRLALLFGGRSGEHEISIISARSIASAVNKAKFDVVPIYITRKGEWLGKSASQKVLNIDVEPLLKSPKALKKTHADIAALTKKSRFNFDFSNIDVAFPALHGTFGEDGTVQGCLDMFNVPYVGCGVLASALTMDKAFAKVCFQQAGLNVGAYHVVRRSDLKTRLNNILDAAEAELGYPMFVKPANSGSSVGISKAKTRSDLKAALTLAAQYDRKLLIEKGIDAREIEVAALGNDTVVTSAIGEIVPCNEFYDYDAKYVKGDSKLFIPADLSDTIAAEVHLAAKIAYQSTGCEGMARVDFFLERGTNTLYINELNTIPGFTSISMYPKLFAAAGLPYPKLINRLIALALERHKDIQRNKI